MLVSADRSSALEIFNLREIDTAVHYPILDSEQQAWKGNFEFSTIPNSEELVLKIITLPLFLGMTELEIQRVESAILEIN